MVSPADFEFGSLVSPVDLMVLLVDWPRWCYSRIYFDKVLYGFTFKGVISKGCCLIVIYMSVIPFIQLSNHFYIILIKALK